MDQGLTTPPSHRASNVFRRRLRLEVGLAMLSVLLFFATTLWPEWIEIVFGVDPDFGNGQRHYSRRHCYLTTRHTLPWLEPT